MFFYERDSAWNVSKYGVLSGPYFPVFRSENTPYLDPFHTVKLSFCSFGKSFNGGVPGVYENPWKIKTEKVNIPKFSPGGGEFEKLISCILNQHPRICKRVTQK